MKTEIIQGDATNDLNAGLLERMYKEFRHRLLIRGARILKIASTCTTDFETRKIHIKHEITYEERNPVGDPVSDPSTHKPE